MSNTKNTTIKTNQPNKTYVVQLQQLTLDEYNEVSVPKVSALSQGCASVSVLWDKDH